MIPRSIKLLAALLLLLAVLDTTTGDPNRRGRNRMSKIWEEEAEVKTEGKKTEGVQSRKDSKQRTGRFFSLFNVVQFKQDACTSDAGTTGSGNQRNGTCMTMTECQDKGGTASGNCAAGFGACCVFTVNDGSAISQNCTYIQNPSFPGTDNSANAITYTVNKCNDDVCFLRLDFENFVLRGTTGTNIANEDGVCTDTFIVTTPTNQVIPTICGTNTGYHMYVDIGANSGDTAQLAFTFMGTAFQRMFDIKVTQIECTNEMAPPDSCLQYHTGLTGRIETFNYAAMTDNHLQNQNYQICIRPMTGFCCVRYQVCPDQPPAQAMSLAPDDTGLAQQDDQCQTHDYIAIAGSSGMCNLDNLGTNSRYCGNFLNSVAGGTANAGICDCTPPFSVGIFTNAAIDKGGALGVNTIFSRGVCLEYMQVAC